jgi:hypothetical protein
MPDEGRTALYRLYDADERLLYVGITADPEYRWTQHAKDKEWWPSVARKSVEWFEARGRAASAEISTIRQELPQYNRQHASWPVDDALRHQVRTIGVLELANNLPAIIGHVLVTGAPVRVTRHWKPTVVIIPHWAADESVVPPSKQGALAEIPIEKPRVAAEVLHQRMSKKDLVTLTQALVALVAKG